VHFARARDDLIQAINDPGRESAVRYLEGVEQVVVDAGEIGFVDLRKLASAALGQNATVAGKCETRDLREFVITRHGCDLGLRGPTLRPWLRRLPSVIPKYVRLDRKGHRGKGENTVTLRWP
jgi:hypothetical protein